MKKVDNRGYMATTSSEHTQLIIEKVSNSDGVWLAASNSSTQLTIMKHAHMEKFISGLNQKISELKAKIIKCFPHSFIRFYQNRGTN